MKRTLLLGFFLSSLFFTACGAFRSVDMPMMGAYETEESYSAERKMFDSSDNMMAVSDTIMAPTGGDGAYNPEVADRKIIYTATLTLHVEDVREIGAEIGTLVEGMGGNVIDSSLTRGENAYTGWYTLKVPVEQFEAALNGLKELAVYVDSEYSNAQDVTEYYTDLETRLSNKQAEEAQYLEILERAVTVDEVLSVTSYLSSVRYEIESLQGQIKYYDSQTAYSTITVYLNEDESISAVTETWKPVSTLRGAFSDWVVFLQGTVDAVVYLLIFGWPFLLLAWGVRSFLRRGKKTKR